MIKAIAWAVFCNVGASSPPPSLPPPPQQSDMCGHRHTSFCKLHLHGLLVATLDGFLCKPCPSTLGPYPHCSKSTQCVATSSWKAFVPQLRAVFGCSTCAKLLARTCLLNTVSVRFTTWSSCHCLFCASWFLASLLKVSSSCVWLQGPHIGDSQTSSGSSCSSKIHALLSVRSHPFSTPNSLTSTQQVHLPRTLPNIFLFVAGDSMFACVHVCMNLCP